MNYGRKQRARQITVIATNNYNQSMPEPLTPHQSVSHQSGPNQFLPDMCRLPVMLAVLLVTEVVMILYVLSISPLGSYAWQTLSLLSLYGQWIALLSVAGLCRLRPQLNRQTPVMAALLCFCWVITVVVATNIIAQWIYAGGRFQGFSLQWLLRDTTIIAVLAALSLRYMYVQESLRAEQAVAHKATLDALHARIRPHFLFNSMNTIASLIRYAPEDAEKAVEDLAAMFRATLAQNDVLVEWRQELALCKAYLRLEQQRLGRRLQVEWQLDDLPADFQVPPLTLQPLVENAIYHGIEQLTDGGTLVICASLHSDCVKVSVTNPLAVLSSSDRGADPVLESKGKQHNGLALENIRARLQAIYKLPQESAPRLFNSDAEADLAISTDSQQFVASMTLPLKPPAEPWTESPSIGMAERERANHA